MDFNPLPPYGGRRNVVQIPTRNRRDFNPLPPYGGRQMKKEYQVFYVIFQSTPSVWRETPRSSPRATRDPSFQSTPSVWRET